MANPTDGEEEPITKEERAARWWDEVGKHEYYERKYGWDRYADD